jgi:hypothetical protein
MRARAGLLLAAHLLGAAVASAQVFPFFNRPGSGARAAGMANAFIAISDDGTAVSWNPAGLGQLRRPEVSLVGATLARSFSAEGFRTRDDLAVYSPIRSSYASTFLEFASLAVPVTIAGKPVTFQAAWRRLYSLDFRESISTTREPLVPEGPPALRIDGNDDIVGAIDLLSIAGAIKLTPRVALGTSFNLWRGDWRIDEVASVAALDPPGPTAFRQLRQDNRIDGESLSAGLLLTYPRWSAGLLYLNPLHADLRTTNSIAISGVPPLPTEVVEGTIRFARAVGLGGAWRPASRWTVALDLTWDEWSGAELETSATGRVNFFDEQPLDRTSTRDTLSVNAGAEHLFLGEGFVVPLRFGAAWEPQGPRSPYTRDPVNYVMLAAGGGYNTNRFKLDAAVQFRWSHFRDGGGYSFEEFRPLLPSSVGERSIKEWRLKLSLILRFADTR